MRYQASFGAVDVVTGTAGEIDERWMKCCVLFFRGASYGATTTLHSVYVDGVTARSSSDRVW